MQITNHKELISFIQKENDFENIKQVFEKCFGSRIVFTMKGEEDERIQDLKDRLIRFINKHHYLDISERPILVNPFLD